MAKFIFRRVMFGLVSIVVATFIVMVLSRLSGDPLLLYANSGYGLTAEGEAALREKLNLDKPLVVQYVVWLGRTLRGDMGETILDRKPVSRVALQRMPNTLQLGLVAWVVSTIIGIPLGVLSAVRRGSVFDYLGRFVALLGQALPQFWFGLVLIMFFAVYLGWLPAGLRGDGFWDVKHWLLPVAVLSFGPIAGYLRLTRSAMLQVLDSEYVRLARAKGISNQKVIWKHAFRNALMQPLTASILILTGFVDGAVLVEAIFAWPGVGGMALTAVNNNDFPLLQGIVFLLTILYVSMMTISDILYAVVDPRIRYT